eukprot:TRINITY_DN15291_c0_g1_i1.p1 TRINITY_DN15291_c0_g1~~TRINITY_DN15291_c0_g1_i1.p1  ORF type:complete len:670 (-),score=130.46 TRINITY_DN15291_c0_g1_i1:26-1939(-)
MSDAVVACRAGDEDFHAEEGPSVYDKEKKTVVPYTGPIHMHPGHYNNRVWTMCELFMATSNFQHRFRGEAMPVFSINLDCNGQIVEGPEEQSAILHSQFHEMQCWSMPPRENLVSQEDLKMLEPLIVMLADESMPRIVRSAKYGLPHALAGLLAAGDDANACDPTFKEAALHDAARAHDKSMLDKLLSLSGIEVNIQNRAGQTPLHLLVASGMFDYRFEPDRQKACVAALLAAGADADLQDLRGRSPVDLAVARYGTDWVKQLFPHAAPQVQQLCANSKSLRQSRVASELQVHIEEDRRVFEESCSVIRWRRVSKKKEADRAKETVVCFSSGLASGWMYLEWAQRLVQEVELEVILVDPPGNGHSELRRGKVKSPLDLQEEFDCMQSSEELLDFYCKDLVTVIHEQGWGKQQMHLVGTSFGGIIAAHLALRHPEWAKSVTLYGWLHSVRHSPAVKENLLGMVKQLVSLFNEENTEDYCKALDGFLSATTPEPLRELFHQACRPGGDVYENSGGMNMVTLMLYALMKNVLSLSRIAVPVLAVQGEADAMFMDHALQLKRLLPHCRLSIVPHVCHLPPVENPVDACAIFLDFLNQQQAAGSVSRKNTRSRTLATASMRLRDTDTEWKSEESNNSGVWSI